MLNATTFGLSRDDDSNDQRALTDIVRDLRLATSKEERARFASQLRSAVDAVKPFADPTATSRRITHTEERGPAVTALTHYLQALLDSPTQSDRLAAIAAFTALIHTETESVHARVQRATNALRVLFSTHATDLPTAQAASAMVSVLSDVPSPLAARAVDCVLSNAINLVSYRSLSEKSSHPFLSVDRARAAMVITELASVNKTPKFVLRHQETLREHLLDVIWDRKSSVREKGVHGLQAILETVVLRAEPSVSSKAMNEVLMTLRSALLMTDPSCASKLDTALPSNSNASLLPYQNDFHRINVVGSTETSNGQNPSSSAIIHGSLCMLKSLITSVETRPYMKSLSSEICRISLCYQAHADPLVRKAVAEILPVLVGLDRAKFADSFLEKVHSSTNELIANNSIPSSERGCSLVSLATLWVQMGNSNHQRTLRDILRVCKETLQSSQNATRIPTDAVLKTISILAGACCGHPVFEKEIRNGLLLLLFNTNFTRLLVSSVESVRSAMPSLDEFIRGSLINLIASTLLQGIPNRRTGMPKITPAHNVDDTNMKTSPQQTAFNQVESLSNDDSSSNAVGNGPGIPHENRGNFEGGMETAPSDPIDFFKQYSFSLELQQIDRAGSLSSKAKFSSVDDLLSNLTFHPPNVSDSDGTVFSSADQNKDIQYAPCVALNAIVNYNFKGLRSQDLTTFANEYVICYVESTSVRLRALAVAASARLMEVAAQVWEETKRGRAIATELQPEIHGILFQLIKVTVADPSPDVRFVALRCLDKPEFHRYLLQSELLNTVIMSLYDESLAIRDCALTIISKLLQDNPAYVFPALRLYLTHLLMVLRCDGEYMLRRRQEVTELINALVHYAPYFTESYADVLMEAFILRLEEIRDSQSAEHALPVLLSIAKMGGLTSHLDLNSYKESLVPLIVAFIVETQGVDPSFRTAALKALGAVILNTGFVIKPYVDHSMLLPRLLELLRVESDAKVRLEVQALLGFLGAVDPEEHKYATLPNLSVGSHISHISRGLGSEMHGKSLYRTGSQISRGSIPWYSTSHRTLSRVSSRSSVSVTDFRRKQAAVVSHQQSQSLKQGYTTEHDGADDIEETAFLNSSDFQPSLSWYSYGGAQLDEFIIDYIPEWSRDEIEYVSLVGQLEHPFTASPDYFSSVLLDELHKLISNRNPRHYVREACQAVVRVLESVGSRCTYFLPEVVPRMLWLTNQLLSHEALETPLGLNVIRFVIERVGDIITMTGLAFLPYSFDAVLLISHYLRRFKSFPFATEPLCLLLIKIRLSIGNEFKPVIATLLPCLLAILAHGRDLSVGSIRSVLSALESFCPLYEEHDQVLLSGLTEIIFRERVVTIRVSVLQSMVRILQSVGDVKVFPCIVHPLIQIFVGNIDSTISFSRATANYGSPTTQHVSSRDMPDVVDKRDVLVLSAAALFEIGNRSYNSFNVFVPVVTKALKCSPLKLVNFGMYDALKSMLLKHDPCVVQDLLGDTHVNQDHGGHSPRAMTETDFEALKLPFTLPANAFPDGVSFCFEPGAYSTPRAPMGCPYIIEEALVRKWAVESHFRGNDWVNWITDLCSAMFQHSGCPAFRACVRMSEVHPSFTKNLFNAAFLSCWTSPLSQMTKAYINDSFMTAISSPTIPLNVLQSLLNLIEYMDHDEKPLSAAPDKLAVTASRCGALAKAIRYREQSYRLHLVGEPAELRHEVDGDNGLIAIYEKLGHIESAVGTVYHYEQTTGDRVTEQWYEKLQRWDNALAVYESVDASLDVGTGEELFQNRRKWEATLGRLRCLNQGGHWRRMIPLLNEARIGCNGNEEAIRQLAIDGKALSVTFDLGLWEEFEDWLKFISTDTYEGCFYNAVLLVKQRNTELYSKAETFITQARHHLDLELTARGSEGYPRAYSHVVRAQVLSELQEMISYLRAPSSETTNVRKRLLGVWNQRLAGCKRDRSTWYRLLMIRSLILSPIENKSQWLEFATMCRKAKLLPMASEALHMLVSSYAAARFSVVKNDSPDPTPPANAQQEVDVSNQTAVISITDLDLKFACIKHLWALNKRIEAYNALEGCRDEFLAPLSNGTMDVDFNGFPRPGSRSSNVLTGEVFSKLSKWGHRLRESGEVEPTSIADPLDYARKATEVRPEWYKAWHYWAVMNGARFEALLEKAKEAASLKSSSQTRQARDANVGNLIGQAERYYLSKTVTGYFRAIDLCGKSRLEDSLKVLTLWFRYGGYSNMHHEFNRGFDETNITRWLEVVPQIIARLHTPYAVIQKGVKRLLTRIGTAHPHVAVYPLTVAKSAGNTYQEMRSRTARDILEELKAKHVDIVEQAELVARELVRVAVLWTEMWYEKLEEASKIYFVDHDVDGMIEILLPLHEEMEEGAQTSYEKEFLTDYGRDLHDAASLCRQYQRGRKEGEDEETLEPHILQAWNLYGQVFRKIQKHQQSMMDLNLSHVSFGLNHAHGLTLAVPGTYKPDENVPVVRIEAFNPHLTVIQSKQRPRKLSIIGSNGLEYHFLLKGHEDLRQDERVMQVFGLINKLFAKSERRNLLNGVGMTTYSVVALSSNAGLIEWVPNCDTLHALVKNYREVRKIVPNIEQRVMLRCAQEPERLSLLQKVDLFEYMLSSTSGGDLEKILWLKSRNSEMWLDRRTTYAKSLATTSMTGYLLGLGDRHPSNLMIERSSGKIMHIDFGDCFEVAMKRDKYPERVPFRLTRMLVEVLEPCGVDGYFRHTCVATLEVLRQKNAKESMMSMMEAFVYDPLIRWKLLGAEELTQLKEEEDAARAKEVERGREFSNRNVHMSSVHVSVAERQHGEGIGNMRSDPEVSEIIRSVNETGSLAESVRRWDVREQRRHTGVGNAEQAENSEPADAENSTTLPEVESGGIAVTGGGSNNRNADINMDHQTPSYDARSKQQRVLDEMYRHQGAGSHERITAVSNERAQMALDRIESKLSGSDFDDMSPLSVNEQVERLIYDARNIENLCTLFLGWCAFW